MPEQLNDAAFVESDGPEYWYALRVRSRCEKAVQRALLARGYEQFLPLHTKRSQWSDRAKDVRFPLFPGYIFSRFDFARRVPLLCIPGVIHIIGNGNMPIAIREHELKAIARFLDSGLPVTPWPYLQIGQTVVVRRGSLTGVEGILLKLKGQSRLVVSVTLLQRSVAVEIERDWVTSTGSAPANDDHAASAPGCQAKAPAPHTPTNVALR
jgi:transcription antitermination factor NusG